MAKLPINARVLRWAIQDSAASVSDLASSTQKTERQVNRWLDGDDLPYKGDLEKIAQRLGRPTAFFFLPSPPDRIQLSAQYRNRPGASPDERIQSQEILALKSAASLQRIAGQLIDRSPLQFPALTDDPARYANRLRVWLDWDISTQTRATSKIKAFRLLRESVEIRGVIVLERDIGAKTCRGFSLPHAVAPLALVNKGYEFPSVRSFTLIHELAHLARGEEYLCHDRNPRIERWCDGVAAAFLMPEDNFRAYVYDRLHKAAIESTDLDSVRRLANYFKTSWEASARRLVELNLASRDLIETVISREIPETGFSPGGGLKTHELRLNEFGTRLTTILVHALQEDRIADLDVRRSLRVDGRQLKELSFLALSGVA